MSHSPHARRPAEPDDRCMITAALIAAILGAIVVDVRHRTFLVAVEEDPRRTEARRAQFLLESWLTTSPAMVLLVLAQVRG